MIVGQAATRWIGARGKVEQIVTLRVACFHNFAPEWTIGSKAEAGGVNDSQSVALRLLTTSSATVMLGMLGGPFKSCDAGAPARPGLAYKVKREEPSSGRRCPAASVPNQEPAGVE